MVPTSQRHFISVSVCTAELLSWHMRPSSVHRPLTRLSKKHPIDPGQTSMHLVTSPYVSELMKSKFVRRPSVCVAIVSEPNAQVSFKCWLLPPLDHTLRHFFYFTIFYEYLSFSLISRPPPPCGSQIFKMLPLLQMTAESFQTFPEFPSQCSSQKYCFGFLKF